MHICIYLLGGLLELSIYVDRRSYLRCEGYTDIQNRWGQVGEVGVVKDPNSEEPARLLTISATLGKVYFTHPLDVYHSFTSPSLGSVSS